MADPNERVPTHDFSHEPQRSAFNAEGWTDVVDGQGTGAARLIEAKDSTSARVRALMKTKGLSEQEASEQAINELNQRIEGKTADVETYIRLFSKTVLTPEDVKKSRLDDPRANSSIRTFTARAMFYFKNGKGTENAFTLRYGAKDGGIKEVTFKPFNITSVKKAAPYKYEESWEDMDRKAYTQIKKELEELNFQFESPGSWTVDIPIKYDEMVSDAISLKNSTKKTLAVEDKLKGFDF